MSSNILQFEVFGHLIANGLCHMKSLFLKERLLLPYTLMFKSRIWTVQVRLFEILITISHHGTAAGS